jgi:hypothetical protein
MKKNNLFLLCLGALITILVSCKAEGEPQPATIIGKWKQIAGVYSPAFFSETDYFSDDAACAKDDIYEFKANNTFEITEGATKCNPANPQIISSGAYSISSDSKTLTWDGDTYNIVELSASTLKITNAFTNGGNNYTDTQTYQRQP